MLTSLRTAPTPTAQQVNTIPYRNRRSKKTRKLRHSRTLHPIIPSPIISPPILLRIKRRNSTTIQSSTNNTAQSPISRPRLSRFCINLPTISLYIITIHHTTRSLVRPIQRIHIPLILPHNRSNHILSRKICQPSPLFRAKIIFPPISQIRILTINPTTKTQPRIQFIIYNNSRTIHTRPHRQISLLEICQIIHRRTPPLCRRLLRATSLFSSKQHIQRIIIHHTISRCQRKIHIPTLHIQQLRITHFITLTSHTNHKQKQYKISQSHK